MSNSETPLNPKRRGLGRGLEALFEDEESVYPQADPDGHIPGQQRKTVGIETLRPGMMQPRTRFSEVDIEDLSKSVRKYGILQPILVRPFENQDGIYEIIAGERRWRAAQMAQLHEVPIIIHQLDDTQALEIGLIENLQRKDLDPIEEAEGFKRLIEDYGHTAETLGESLGKSRSHIANMMRLLNLPETVQFMLQDGDLTPGHARALINADNPELLAHEVIKKGLSVRETEALAAAAGVQTRPKSNDHHAETKAKDVDTRILEEDLSNKLGMKVSIDTKGDGRKGRVTIQFASLDQLDHIITKIGR